MFYNISNHPSSKWTEGQLEAARKLGGEIVDIPFPAIEPEMTDREICSLADELVRKVQKQAAAHEGPSCAMIQGHYIMTVILVGNLTHGQVAMKCYAAETRRVAEEVKQEDGTIAILHKFEFAGFREYPYIQLWD